MGQFEPGPCPNEGQEQLQGVTKVGLRLKSGISVPTDVWDK